MRRGAALAALLAALLTLPGGPARATEPRAGRPKVCLVLSGGGARGIPHIGVLKVLEELRVPVDCIVGTSAGAIIGGAYASGAAPADIERMIGAADWNHLLSDLPARINRSVYAKEVERTGIGGAEVGLQGSALALRRGVVIGQQLQFFLQTLVAPATQGPFDALPVQYRALATDFESGRLVVLDHGDLAAAIRASMSVPGAFAPVEIDGAMLVDGGLVRNLGIDVAHELGAEVVIAVNVGSPLLRRSELGSLLGAAEQTLTILTEQNVDVSLAALGPEDVLITPELGSLSSSDFAHGSDYIPAGELATRRAARALAPLSVSEAEYARWRAQQRRARLAPHYDRVVVDTSGLARVPPDSVRRLLGGDPDPKHPDRAIETLLGTDDFEYVEGEVHAGPDGTTLVLHPIEKPWGPDYLRAGVTLSANFEGSSAFTLYADQRRTWLNDSGLEWRNRLSIGQLDSIASELRLPFDAARRVFIAPRLLASEELMDLYVADEPLESYRRRSFRTGVDLGLRFGNLGEISGGIEGGATGIARTVGAHVVPDQRGRISDLHVHYVFDGLDDLDFPRQGFLLSGTGEWAGRFAGGAVDYKRLTLDAQQAFGTERSSFLLAARYQSALGTDLPFYEQFTAGGFQNLSGLRPDQILSDRIAFLRLVYRRHIASFSAVLPAVYAGLSLEGASLGPQAGGVRGGQTKAGSLFLSGDSALGPFYLGVGLADGGFGSFYFLVGRP